MLPLMKIAARLRQMSVCGLALAAVAGPFAKSSHADFLMSNLTATQGFNSQSGYTLTGPKATTGQGFVVAVEFTIGSGTSFAFDSAQLALAYRAGTNSLNVSLVTDLKGSPTGTTLETMNLTNIAAVPGLATATSRLHPILAAGVSYWLVAAYGAPDTNIAWLFNSTSHVGSSAYRSDSATQQGSWVAAPTLTDPGYALFGTAAPAANLVPAPPSGVLVGIGALGLCGGRLFRRRRLELRPDRG